MKSFFGLGAIFVWVWSDCMLLRNTTLCLEYSSIITRSSEGGVQHSVEDLLRFRERNQGAGKITDSSAGLNSERSTFKNRPHKQLEKCDSFTSSQATSQASKEVGGRRRQKRKTEARTSTIIHFTKTQWFLQQT
jgi:hypothetical protein